MNNEPRDSTLMEVLQCGGEEQSLAFFQGMPEKKRRGLAPECLKWLRNVMRNDFTETDSGRVSRYELVPTARIAAFATASLSELQKLPLHSLPNDSLAFRILLDRRPPWIHAWATRLLDDETYWWHWRLVRDLVTAGLMEKPEHPNYYLGMISGIASHRRVADQGVTIEQCLEDDPALLEDEVWRLFEFEGGGLNSLANWDRFESHTWHDALLSFVRREKLSRDRLLTCSLDALERDFNHYRAKWFCTFHDALEPSEKERQAFGKRYLGLLGVSAPNVVTWALKKVEGLAKSDTLQTELLLSSIVSVLESRQKGTVKKGLKLLEHVAKTNDTHRQSALFTATAALGHEASDIQQATLDLVDKFGSESDAELASRMAEYSDHIAASLHNRFERWRPAVERSQAPQPDVTARKAVKSLDVTSSSPAEELDQLGPELCHLLSIDTLRDNLSRERLEIPVVGYDGMDIPRLRGREKLAPIQEIDELIDVCARVVEDDSLVDDAERGLDGLSRLCETKPANFAGRIGPLHKRVTQRLKRDAAPFGGFGPADDLCGVIYAWITGHVIRGERRRDRHYSTFHFMVEGEERTLVGSYLDKAISFLSRRSFAIAERVAVGRSAALLSAPTHADGWIAADELIRRVNRWGEGEPHLTDVCLAMLRLAPDDRAVALSQLEEDGLHAKTEWGQSIRHALGAPDAVIGKTEAYWLAAARARAPWSDDERVMRAFPDHGPDAGEAASYRFGPIVNKHGHQELSVVTQPPVPPTVNPDWVTVTLHIQIQPATRANYYVRGTAGRSIGSIRWTATIWPQARESFCALAALDIAENIDWWESRWENKSLLDPLLDSGTPLRPMSILLLALALAAKEPGESGLATDIAIRAIEEGRLVPSLFGPTLAALLPTGQIKPGRWQKAFANIARHSSVHALVIQQSLQQCLRGTVESMPRDYGKLLDLLKELSFEIQQPIVDEDCRAFLARINPGGKAGKAAKELLALPPIAFSQSGRALLLEALAQRQDAARKIGVN